MSRKKNIQPEFNVSFDFSRSDFLIECNDDDFVEKISKEIDVISFVNLCSDLGSEENFILNVVLNNDDHNEIALKVEKLRNSYLDLFTLEEACFIAMSNYYTYVFNILENLSTFKYAMGEGNYFEYTIDDIQAVSVFNEKLKLGDYKFRKDLMVLEERLTTLKELFRSVIELGI